MSLSVHISAMATAQSDSMADSITTEIDDDLDVPDDFVSNFSRCSSVEEEAGTSPSFLESNTRSSKHSNNPKPNTCLQYPPVASLNGSISASLMILSTSLGRSLDFSKSTGSIHSVPHPHKGVRIRESQNNVFEISTLSTRLQHGFKDLFWGEVGPVEEVLECYVCKDEPVDEAERGKYRIFNIPDGWEILCPACKPPDSTWEFDRTVFIPPALLPLELLSHVFLYAQDLCLAARVCKQWNSLAWTRLYLSISNPWLLDIVENVKMWNVTSLNLRIAASAYNKHKDEFQQLLHGIANIKFLITLTVKLVDSDTVIIQLADALQGHQYLQLVDVSDCIFYAAGLRSLVSALENHTLCEIQVPPCALEDGPDHSLSHSRRKLMLSQLTVGTSLTLTVIGDDVSEDSSVESIDEDEDVVET